MSGSSRTKLVSEGYGPMVSVGVTAQAAPAPEPPAVVPLVVEVAVVTAPELPQPSDAAAAPATPSMPSASRRLSLLICMSPPGGR